MTLEDTIAAISTPVGEGAIAVLRVSGSESRTIVSRIFRGNTGVAEWEPRRLYLGEVWSDDGKIDQVLGTYFRAPQSYTGQDLIEMSCHGGILVTRQILALLLRYGARSAEPGEFTQRAFLNGKMDLTQAEAVMDVIHAQTELALRAANEQLAGRLGSELRQLQDALPLPAGILRRFVCGMPFFFSHIRAALKLDQRPVQVRQLERRLEI